MSMVLDFRKTRDVLFSMLQLAENETAKPVTTLI